MLPIVHAWAKAKGVEVATAPDAPNQAVLKPGGPLPFPVRVAQIPERHVLWFQVEFNDTIPEPRYFEFCRAMAILNASIYVGSWNLITQQGKAYFKLSMPTKGLTLTEDTVDFALQLVVGSVQSTAQKLFAVGLNNAPAQSVRP